MFPERKGASIMAHAATISFRNFAAVTIVKTLVGQNDSDWAFSAGMYALCTAVWNTVLFADGTHAPHTCP